MNRIVPLSPVRPDPEPVPVFLQIGLGAGGDQVQDLLCDALLLQQPAYPGGADCLAVQSQPGNLLKADAAGGQNLPHGPVIALRGRVQGLLTGEADLNVQGGRCAGQRW